MRTVKLERVEAVSKKTGEPFIAYVIHMTQKVAGVDVPVKSDWVFPRFTVELEGGE